MREEGGQTPCDATDRKTAACLPSRVMRHDRMTQSQMAPKTPVPVPVPDVNERRTRGLENRGS